MENALGGAFFLFVALGVAGAVAEAIGRVVRFLAPAHEKHPGHEGDEGDRLEFCSFVRAVAPGLTGAEATTAPDIGLAFFDLHLVWRALGAVGLIHGSGLLAGGAGRLAD